MRLSRKMTEYGKERYNWNFFKMGKGYKVNSDAKWNDTTKRVGFGWFNNEPNTTSSIKYSDLEIYILKADAFTPSQDMPYYYDKVANSSNNPIWPTHDSDAKETIKSDYSNIVNHYIYKIKIVNNEELMIVGDRQIDPPSYNCQKPLYEINLSYGFYKIFICTTERFDRSSFGCHSNLNGWYYSVYSNTIFVDAITNTNNCFRSVNSGLQDYELQMLSDSNEIQEIPSNEMVAYNRITDQNNYNSKVRITLDNGDDVWTVGTRTKINEGWYYAYNKHKKMDPAPKGILGGNDNSNITYNTRVSSKFLKWLTVTIPNENGNFSIDVEINNNRYQLIDNVSYQLLKNVQDDNLNISPIISKYEDDPKIGKQADPTIELSKYYRHCYCTFKKNDSDVVIQGGIPNVYSKWYRNEVIPIVSDYNNCIINSINNPVFYQNLSTAYTNDNGYQSKYSHKIPGFILDDEEGEDPHIKGSNYGCFLIFKETNNTNQLEIYIMVDNPTTNEAHYQYEIPSLEISGNTATAIRQCMPNDNINNGKIDGDYILSPINYIKLGEQNLPPYTTPTNNQNGGN